MLNIIINKIIFVITNTVESRNTGKINMCQLHAEGKDKSALRSAATSERQIFLTTKLRPFLFKNIVFSRGLSTAVFKLTTSTLQPCMHHAL